MDKIYTPSSRVIAEKTCGTHDTGIPDCRGRRQPFLTTEHISPGRMSSPSTDAYLHSGELTLSLPATTQVYAQFRFISKEPGEAATTAALIELRGGNSRAVSTHPGVNPSLSSSAVLTSAARIARAASANDAPVVMTSSTSTIRPPEARSARAPAGTSRAPARLARRRRESSPA
ncbi:hypothetical protein [Streptomyces sp. NBC_00009]|uniref:hypothetical protein n=1 Tax=Streptomyces sp. NBC_00009 TaxID=2975620 RepID=UPI0038644997